MENLDLLTNKHVDFESLNIVELIDRICHRLNGEYSCTDIRLLISSIVDYSQVNNRIQKISPLDYMK